jgi:tRNA (cmo5U34)-methyltransferase
VSDDRDTNDAVWKSADGVSYWLSTADERERRRGEQRRLMAELLPYAGDERFCFLDLGAGTGAAARAVLDRYPGAFAILADYSAQMMGEGERALSSYGGRYAYVELDLRGGPWPEAIPAQVDAVITSLSVHHLPDERKQQLFGEILARLAPGGWYLNYDAVAAGDALVAEAWQRTNDRLDPEAADRRAHATPEERLRHENHVRYMIPLGTQLGFLREAGFEAIDVYWKQLDYVIYGGRRPLGDAAARRGERRGPAGEQPASSMPRC